MKKYYRVSFKYSENVYCSNIAHAECVEDVNAHYNKYECVMVDEASEANVKSAERRGMPIIEVEHTTEETRTEIKEYNNGLDNVIEFLSNRKDRSAWDKGVTTEGNFYTISDIEKMPEALAFLHALDRVTIKNHFVYFVDFGGYFGYSAIVYCNGHQIKYANDYQLHHKNKTPEELHSLYIDELNSKLFTDDELSKIENYEDYTRKFEFLRDLYGHRANHISIWFTGSDAERKARQEKIKSMYYSPVCFAYFENPEIVEKINKLFNDLETAKNSLKENFEYQKSAFLHEMYNHEYGINWQADYDTISAFANVANVKDYTNLSELFELAKFNDIQKSAYIAARNEYFTREADRL